MNRVDRLLDPQALDHVEDAELFLLLQRSRPLQDPGSSADGRKRITQVMTKHGYELLAQFRGLPFGSESFLELRPRIHQLAFVAPPIGRLDDYQGRE